MLSRPFDSVGDVLPILSPADLLSGPSAVSAGLRDHLHLFPGDWWEDPEAGNELFDLISISRRSESDADTLSSAICAYIRDFPGVRSLSDIQAGFSGHRFHFSCAAHTETGDTFSVQYDG